VLEADLADCKQVVEGGTLEQVLDALDRLEQSAQRIGELIYSQVDSGTDDAGEG
jgi:hypothetical protein